MHRRLDCHGLSLQSHTVALGIGSEDSRKPRKVSEQIHSKLNIINLVAWMDEAGDGKEFSLLAERLSVW